MDHEWGSDLSDVWMHFPVGKNPSLRCFRSNGPKYCAVGASTHVPAETVACRSCLFRVPRTHVASQTCSCDLRTIFFNVLLGNSARSLSPHAPSIWAPFLNEQRVSFVLSLVASSYCQHRDLKLENILLEANAEEGGVPSVKLVDFGLSAIFEENGMSTDVLGSWVRANTIDCKLKNLYTRISQEDSRNSKEKNKWHMVLKRSSI